jgi:hypothetical protein
VSEERVSNCFRCGEEWPQLVYLREKKLGNLYVCFECFKDGVDLVKHNVLDRNGRYLWEEEIAKKIGGEDEQGEDAKDGGI